MTYRSIKQGNLLHIPDLYISITEACELLSVSRHKMMKIIDADMVVWDQPHGSKRKLVERNSVIRLKHPEIEPTFPELYVKDVRQLYKEMDVARHKIASMANLAPGAIKIYFDLS